VKNTVFVVVQVYNFILLVSYVLNGNSTANVIQSYQSYMECALAAPDIVATVNSFDNHDDAQAHCMELTMKVRSN